MLKGKVAVVTGSTSGIGLGIAGALAAAGADIMINGFGEAAAIKKLREELASAHGVRVAFSAADLSKPTDATGLIEDATRELGRVDVLVNNAGIQHVAPVHEFPIERWNAVIAINLTAVFLTTRRCCRKCSNATGAGSSTSRRYTAWSRRSTNPRTSPQSMASSASPRPCRWRRRRRASPATRSAPAGCSRRWCKSRSTPLLPARSWTPRKQR